MVVTSDFMPVRRSRGRRPMEVELKVKRGHKTELVDWTCPKCGYRVNNQLWLGPEEHVCNECGSFTLIRGKTVTRAIDAQ